MAGNANPRFRKHSNLPHGAHGAVRQERKGTDFPYVAHPIGVAEILDRFDVGEDVVVAGFLHDTIEDTDVTAADSRMLSAPWLLDSSWP